MEHGRPFQGQPEQRQRLEACLWLCEDVVRWVWAEGDSGQTWGCCEGRGCRKDRLSSTQLVKSLDFTLGTAQSQ